MLSKERSPLQHGPVPPRAAPECPKALPAGEPAPEQQPLFTALDQTVIRPLPYANPGSLVVLWEEIGGDPSGVALVQMA